MANFIFNWAAAALADATLDLSTGNYYAHLVTTVPSLSHATVADLVLPAIGGYSPTTLTGLSNNTTRWTFDSFSFPKYAFVSAPTGVVICRRAGANPASTDGIICYSDFNNSIGQTINLQVGTYVINLQFVSAGAINYSYRYQYSSGAYANTETIPKGLIWLIGSQNNTLTFTNPAPSKISVSGVAAALTDRNAAGGANTSSATINIDFINYQVKVGSIGFWCDGNTTIASTISGSNDGINYTVLATPSVAWNFNFQTFIVNSNTYYRFIRLVLSSAGIFKFTEMELYNSTILSPTANFS